MPADLRSRYAPLVDKLRAEQSGWIRDARILHLPVNVPPWIHADIEPERGDRLTVLVAGRVIWSREADLFAGPRYHLCTRIGDGPIFRLGSDTHTLAVTGHGPHRLCIYHGTWASPDGTLATSRDAYAALEGGFDVLLIRWGDASPEQGVAAWPRPRRVIR